MHTYTFSLNISSSFLWIFFNTPRRLYPFGTDVPYVMSYGIGYDIRFDYSVDGRNFVVPAYARKYFGATKGTWTV